MSELLHDFLHSVSGGPRHDAHGGSTIHHVFPNRSQQQLALQYAKRDGIQPRDKKLAPKVER